jgi:hypothetical protein
MPFVRFDIVEGRNDNEIKHLLDVAHHLRLVLKRSLLRPVADCAALSRGYLDADQRVG